jgi:hypothetical protein
MAPTATPDAGLQGMICSNPLHSFALHAFIMQ